MIRISADGRVFRRGDRGNVPGCRTSNYAEGHGRSFCEFTIPALLM